MLIAEGLARYLSDDLTIDLDYRPDRVGGSLYVLGMPDSPHRAVSITEYPGRPGDSKFAWDRPSVQVQVRGEPDDPVGPDDLAQEIYKRLHALRMVRLPDGTWLTLCRGIQSGALNMGQDEELRYRFALNFETEIEAAGLGNRVRQ